MKNERTHVRCYGGYESLDGVVSLHARLKPGRCWCNSNSSGHFQICHDNSSEARELGGKVIASWSAHPAQLPLNNLRMIRFTIYAAA